jgi:hypothetical protein
MFVLGLVPSAHFQQLEAETLGMNGVRDDRSNPATDNVNEWLAKQEPDAQSRRNIERAILESQGTGNSAHGDFSIQRSNGGATIFAPGLNLILDDQNDLDQVLVGIEWVDNAEKRVERYMSGGAMFLNSEAAPTDGTRPGSALGAPLNPDPQSSGAQGSIEGRDPSDDHG